MIILSILIPTTPDRHEMFTALFNELHRQLEYMQTFHPSLGRVEILVDDSKLFLEGGLSIGKKREALVKRAEGKYLCFVDSDDWIAPNYLETLVRLAQSNADVLSFRNISKMDNFWMIVDMSLRHEDNIQASPYYIVYRKPFHICPVRTIFAKLHDFEDINDGEDWKWMEQVLSHCIIEAKTDSVIHEYRHSKLISESHKIMNHALAK